MALWHKFSHKEFLILLIARSEQVSLRALSLVSMSGLSKNTDRSQKKKEENNGSVLAQVARGKSRKVRRIKTVQYICRGVV